MDERREKSAPLMAEETPCGVDWMAAGREPHRGLISPRDHALVADVLFKHLCGAQAKEEVTILDSVIDPVYQVEIGLILHNGDLIAFSGAMAHTGCVLRLTFCDANIINYYLCDILPVLQLSCISTYVNELMVFVVGVISIILASLTNFISYGLILSSILCINSTECRSKAFSTCSSYVIAVSLFFGSGTFTCFKISSAESVGEGKIFSVFYTNIFPMIYPFINSFSNKDVKLALMKTLSRRSSLVTEFILLGLTEYPKFQLPLFFFFLEIYIVTVAGNLGLIILIGLNAHLHTPMYYFLFNLSFIDLCYSSVISPKLLVNFVSKVDIISYSGCMTQLFFYYFFVNAECYVLTVLAYDCYVAICKPLLYTVTMSHQSCSILTVIVYVGAFVAAWTHTGCMLRMTFCDANINHYVCGILPLLDLSCTSTHINELVVFAVVGFDVGVPSVTIIASYAFILSIILIHSREGRSKAFSTCSSYNHIIVVSVFFGSGTFMYLHPSSVLFMNQGKVSTAFYTIVVSMLNPLIYSFRNKEVKITLKKKFFVQKEVRYNRSNIGFEIRMSGLKALQNRGIILLHGVIRKSIN
ncbi:LOW QUALITY PROTEIN: olfactory receptor 8B3-like [Dugong dugon]